MNEIFGFLTLAWPLLAMLLVIIGLIIVIWLARKWAAKKGLSQRKIMLTAGVIFILIFSWDVILGRAYFYHLCTTKGGMKVNKQIELPVEYSLVQFPNARWLYKKMPIAEQYPLKIESEENIPGPGNIDYVRYVLYDSATSEILGTITDYSYGGGWFENSIRFHGAGGGNCGLKDGYFKIGRASCRERV